MLAALGVYVCQAMFHELTYTPIDNSLVFLLARHHGRPGRQSLPSGYTALSFGNVLGQCFGSDARGRAC